MKKQVRVLARELAVEEIANVGGAYHGDWGSQTGPMGETSSGCTMPDESYFTIYDQGPIGTYDQK